jgi:hypothetical protein
VQNGGVHVAAAPPPALQPTRDISVSFSPGSKAHGVCPFAAH